VSLTWPAIFACPYLECPADAVALWAVRRGAGEGEGGGIRSAASAWVSRDVVVTVGKQSLGDEREKWRGS